MSREINAEELERRLQQHKGHRIEWGLYGSRFVVNVAIECVDCFEVLVDIDTQEPEEDEE